MIKQKLINFYCKVLFGIGLIKNKLNGQRIPLMANLLITNRCNLKCFYCYVDAEHRKAQDIEIKKLFELIDTLYRKGTRLIVLLGGEPLLYKRIGDVIRYIKKKRMVCEIITNGYFVKNHIDALAMCDSVCVSLDGDEEANDRNRGKGSYKKGVEAIKLLRKKKVPVRIKAVLTKNNINALDYLSHYVEENDLMLTISIPATYDKRKYPQENKWLNESEKRDFFNNLLCLKKKGAHIGYSFSALNYVLNWPYAEDFIISSNQSNHTEKFNLLRCKRKDHSLYIDADGSMYPCANQWGKNRKNVFSDGFDVAWANMASYDCYACGSLPDVDLTYLLSCNFENIFNAIKFFGRK